MEHTEKLSITPSPEMLQTIRASVSAGEYCSASEAVSDALRLWKQWTRPLTLLLPVVSELSPMEQLKVKLLTAVVTTSRSIAAKFPTKPKADQPPSFEKGHVSHRPGA